MEDKLEIRLSPINSIMAIIFSLMIFGMAFVHKFTIVTLSGFLLFPFGLLSLILPIIVITQDDLKSKNFFGMTLKTYPLNVVEARDDGIYIEGKIKYRKNGIDKSMQDVDAFLKKFKDD